MPAQNRREGSSKGPVIKAPFDGFDDDLAADQRQTDFAPLLQLHRFGKVPGDQYAQAPANPLHTPSKRHAGSITCV